MDSDNLKLTDFMDLSALQAIQDHFAAVASVKAIITDASGNVLTQPTPTKEFLQRQSAIEQAENAQQEAVLKEGREYVAPITVNNRRLGSIRMTASPASAGLDDAKVAQLASRFQMDPKQLKTLSSAIVRARDTRPAAIQFLYFLANAIAERFYRQYLLQQRMDELQAVYNVATMLAEARDLPRVLDRAVQIVCEVMNCKAASIRLIDQEKDELVIRAVHNLSREYLNKGTIRLSRALVDQAALSDKGYEYVPDMTRDPRTQYPEEARREGIVSELSVGMRFKGKPIGVIRVYTPEVREFSQHEITLLKAVAAQAAGAIENARLIAEAREAEALEEQVRMAGEVQQRMIPRAPPKVAGADFASVYVPCYTLGGDLFDFIPLADDNIGMVVADVSGKGVPASLIMASVRSALRAHVDSVFELSEVMVRLNRMLCRDTLDSEFVTLFYGVLDARNRRLTYCNAGHPPAMLLRDGKAVALSADNMVLGLSPDEPYTQTVLDLKRGDTILLYTDGLSEAMNFNKEVFGRARVVKALERGGMNAEVVAQNVLWDMRRFVGLAEQSDDVTIVTARVT